MKYEEIVAKAKELLEGKEAEVKEHLAVQVNVTGEGEGIFYIEAKDGKLDVQPYDYKDNDCVLIASAENLIKIVSGELDPVLAFTTGKLKIEGSVDKALEFKGVITSLKKEKSAAKPQTPKAQTPKAKSRRR